MAMHQMNNTFAEYKKLNRTIIGYKSMRQNNLRN